MTTNSRRPDLEPKPRVEAKACFYDVLMAAVPLVGIMLQFARGKAHPVLASSTLLRGGQLVSFNEY